jgi:methyl-accepting chemotaxis protein
VMAANLTEQVRGIVKVVTAVAGGDLKQQLTVNAKGEVAALADTINNMTSTLAIFADQVTSVAREVGVDGRLGGQAAVPARPAPGRTSPATSTSWPRISPTRCALLPRSPPQSPKVT